MQTAASPKFPCERCEVRDRTICAALDDSELRHLNAISTAVTLSAGQTVFQEGEKDSFLFNVTTGAVRLSKLLPDGQRQITGFLFPGDVLGLSVSGAYAYTADAIMQSSFCRFDRERLAEITEQFPRLEHRLLALASNELVQAHDQLVMLEKKGPSERIAMLLLRLAERIGLEANGVRTLYVPMTLEDLADYLGLTSETVSQTLAQLHGSGVIELPSVHHINIPCVGNLAEMSGEV